MRVAIRMLIVFFITKLSFQFVAKAACGVRKATNAWTHKE